jgi:hypothetical protein
LTLNYFFAYREPPRAQAVAQSIPSKVAASGSLEEAAMKSAALLMAALRQVPPMMSPQPEPAALSSVAIPQIVAPTAAVLPTTTTTTPSPSQPLLGPMSPPVANAAPIAATPVPTSSAPPSRASSIPVPLATTRYQRTNGRVFTPVGSGSNGDQLPDWDQLIDHERKHAMRVSYPDDPYQPPALYFFNDGRQTEPSSPANDGKRRGTASPPTTGMPPHPSPPAPPSPLPLPLPASELAMFAAELEHHKRRTAAAAPATIPATVATPTTSKLASSPTIALATRGTQASFSPRVSNNISSPSSSSPHQRNGKESLLDRGIIPSTPAQLAQLAEEIASIKSSDYARHLLRQHSINRRHPTQ